MKIRGLVPMLGTHNLPKTIKVYKENLGFECRGSYPESEPCWASLWNGDFEIAFSINEKTLSMNGTIYLYVDNVDEVWTRLKDKVEIVYPIENFDYGMREFGIKDNNGYILNIGENIE
jgi:uncharacterized glyoxalase superfamily protein PhnB